LDATTVDEAIEEYRTYQMENGLRPRSVERTNQQLTMFFAEQGGRVMLTLTQAIGQHLYDTCRTRKTARGTTISADSQLNTLGVAKTFVRWAVKRKLARVDFLADVEPVGRRRKGKRQMTTDEARRWLAKALDLADKGDIGAGAAATALLLGLRASEVTDRTVRDLDGGGALLNITSSKTATGIRRLEVPEALRPRLLRLAQGRPADALLFGGRPSRVECKLRVRSAAALEEVGDPTGWLWRHVRRICSLVGVPRVCTHALRGQHGSEATRAGITGHAVAAALGHASFSTTVAHYLAPGTAEAARSQRVANALLGVVTTGADSVTTGQNDAAEVA